MKDFEAPLIKLKPHEVRPAELEACVKLVSLVHQSGGVIRSKTDLTPMLAEKLEQPYNGVLNVLSKSLAEEQLGYAIGPPTAETSRPIIEVYELEPSAA